MGLPPTLDSSMFVLMCPLMLSPPQALAQGKENSKAPQNCTCHVLENGSRVNRVNQICPGSERKVKDSQIIYRSRRCSYCVTRSVSRPVLLRYHGEAVPGTDHLRAYLSHSVSCWLVFWTLSASIYWMLWASAWSGTWLPSCCVLYYLFTDAGFDIYDLTPSELKPWQSWIFPYKKHAHTQTPI